MHHFGYMPSLRLDSPKFKILSTIETIEESSEQSVVLDPRHFTDILSIVQVYTYKGRRRDERKDEFPLVMSGVSPSFATGGTDSRAYYKLKEAMGKYPIDSSIFNGSIALDWTKFLADDMQCSLVYSVDPGELLIDIDNVRHMKMKRNNQRSKYGSATCYVSFILEPIW